MRKGLAGFDQLSQVSGVVIAIISSPRGARAAIDAERRGTEVRALGIGVGVSMPSNGNLMDGSELVDSAFIDFTDIWPSSSSVAADEAQLTRNPLGGLTEKLDFLGIGLGFEGLFGGLGAEVADVKLDFLPF